MLLLLYSVFGFHHQETERELCVQDVWLSNNFTNHRFSDQEEIQTLFSSFSVLIFSPFSKNDLQKQQHNI